MSAELAFVWLDYAKENLQAARLTLEAGLVKPSLQNCQQAIEKALKAVWIGAGETVRKTHCIADLAEDLVSIGRAPTMSEDECILVDSIYLPSKYPTDAVLPEGTPDAQIAAQCIELAGRICEWAQRVLDDVERK